MPENLGIYSVNSWSVEVKVGKRAIILVAHRLCKSAVKQSHVETRTRVTPRQEEADTDFFASTLCLIVQLHWIAGFLFDFVAV